ncbi:MAG TPA: hypothetical protein VK593_05315 [Edaphobacter sp.]|nr:hypothetical protein [Edaphobacter sp.]
MKTTLRKFVLAGVVALLTAAVSTPAHATLSGSEPRPNAPSGATASLYFNAMLAIMGF